MAFEKWIEDFLNNMPLDLRTELRSIAERRLKNRHGKQPSLNERRDFIAARVVDYTSAKRIGIGELATLLKAGTVSVGEVLEQR